MAAPGQARVNRPARWEPPRPSSLDPEPIAQRRGVTLPPHTVSVAPPSRWANPRPGAATWFGQASAVVDYAVWLAGRLDLLTAARSELAAANLACYCPLNGPPCHREVLLDIANPPFDPLLSGGHAMALTVRRPWASLLFVPESLGGIHIHVATFATDYRGPLCIFAGTRIVDAGVALARARGLDADWHTNQTGWLGAAALVNVHPATADCCPRRRIPWAPRTHDDAHRFYHWVFAKPARLAAPTFGRGFIGLRPVSWSALVRRSALGITHQDRQP